MLRRLQISTPLRSGPAIVLGRMFRQGEMKLLLATLLWAFGLVWECERYG